MRKKTVSRLVCMACLLLLAGGSRAATAQTLKGKLSIKNGALVPADFSIVAQSAAGAVRTAPVAADGKFSLTGASLSDRVSLLYRSNFYTPLVLAVRNGKVVKPFTAAVESRLCSKGTPLVILTVSKAKKGAANIEVDASLGVAYLKKVAKDQKKTLLKGQSADADANCMPAGLTGARVKLLTAFSRSAIGTLADDSDGDGKSNADDPDDDNDGVSDMFDGDNDGDGVVDDADPDDNDRGVKNQLFYFQQLHLDREHSFHPKLQTVTTAMIDDALKGFGGLAMEVKTGASVELNCGADEATGGAGLPWCSAGGTGRSTEPFPSGKKFPEEFDSDLDGKAEIVAGPTRDLQLRPGAGSSEIKPGDTFIEEVTDSAGVITKYVGVLNSVVLTVPGIVSITTGVGTYPFDYPPTNSSIGTWANPVMVPLSGDVEITVTVYPPLYQTEAGTVVPGVLTFVTNLPNSPCTLGPGGCSGSGPGAGMLRGELYSNPSAGWTIASDGVRSNTIDKTLNQSEALTYTVNLTGAGGVTGWDAGEYLMVPIQATDGNGTTSAHTVIFRRMPPT